MARKPKPWWNAEKKAWFVNIDGERHKLGAEKDEAHREFHRLLSLPPEKRSSKVEAPSPAGLTVADLLDKYLDWVEKHRAPRTYDWYKEHLDSFVNSLAAPATMPVSDLKPFMVIEWADQHTTWGDNYRRGALIAVQRPFNWAAKLAYIQASPIPYIEKPQATRREQVVTVEEWEAIRDHYDEGDPFRELLEFAWETGCRPQEVKAIESRHVQLGVRRILFPAKEAKGKNSCAGKRINL